jgi:hypothetical protein
MTNTTTEKTPCLRPGCDQPAKIRGLCKRDHSRAHRHVKAGKTTWEALEKAGKILPAKYGFGEKSADCQAFDAWLLGDTTPAVPTTANGTWAAGSERDQASLTPAPAPKPPKGKGGKGPKLVATQPAPTAAAEPPKGLLSQLAGTVEATGIPGVSRRVVD